MIHDAPLFAVMIGLIMMVIILSASFVFVPGVLVGW